MVMTLKHITLFTVLFILSGCAEQNNSSSQSADTQKSSFDQYVSADVKRRGVAVVRAMYPDLKTTDTYVVEPNHLRRLAETMLAEKKYEEARLALEWNLSLFPEDDATYEALAKLSADPSSQYFGQAVPGMNPVRFAPNIVSRGDAFELNAVFSNDGNMFFFTRSINQKFKIFISHRTNTGWTDPEIAPFSVGFPDNRDADMMFAPDGKRLYFISDRPLSENTENGYNIFYTDFGLGEWSEAKPLSNNINSDKPSYYPAIVADGSMYYTTERADTLGGNDSYRAQFNGSGFDEPVNLGPHVNSSTGEGDIFVSPDESYLIHVAAGREDSVGGNDLYISFKDENGKWGDDIHMGDVINSSVIDFCPMVTPDGKYFFFSRGGDVFWVDAKILETFRP